MIVSLRHGFVLLLMPKCASEALLAALSPRADMVFRHPPEAKHAGMQRFERFIRPFIARVGGDRPETLCLMREPEAWLQSWWRYRQRDDLAGQPKSTRGICFERFVGLYLDREGPGSGIGRQVRFVSDREGRVSVDHLFRFEEIEDLSAWIARRTGWRFDLTALNRSPDRVAEPLGAFMRGRLERELAADFELYATLGRGRAA
ncbi:MAG: gamma-glutamyl kinase [Pseudomonadota bacterium]